MVKQLAAGFLVLGLATVGGAQAVTPVATTTPAVKAPQVVIREFKFSQVALTVPVNTTVTWVNRDEESHTVTSATGLFTSPALDPKQAFSYRFTTPGTYAYYCALHPHMTAKVIVK